MEGEAVGRHDVEAGAGEQHDACGLGLGVSIGEGLKNGDLAGDVEVVGSGADAGVGDGFGGVAEWASAAEDRGDVCEGGVDLGWFVDAEDGVAEVELGGEGADGWFVASGEDGAEALLDG